MGPKAIICPSILSADFGRLSEECNNILSLGADWIHVDIMDGHFVPNISIGVPVVKSLRKNHPEAFLDCHLMISEPLRYVEPFVKAGASQYTFHLEATENPGEVIDKVKAMGVKCGIALKPSTPVEKVLPFVDKVDMVLIMTVEPGFGGQKFMSDMMPKVSLLREMFPNMLIQTDGGLALDTIEAAAKAGSNVIVAGSSIFGAEDRGAVIQGLRTAVEKHSK